MGSRSDEANGIVRDGEVVIVTEGGVVVAELGPPGRASIDSSDPIVESLLRRANVTVGAPNRPDLYPLSSVAPPDTAEKLLDEERGDR